VSVCLSVKLEIVLGFWVLGSEFSALHSSFLVPCPLEYAKMKYNFSEAKLKFELFLIKPQENRSAARAAIQLKCG